MRRIGLNVLWALPVLVAGCGGGGSGDAAPSSGSTAGPPTATASAADAVRYLEQASFGPTSSTVAAVQASGIAAAIDQQLATPSTGYPGYSYEDPNSNNGCPSGSANTCFRDHYTLFPLQNQFFRNAVSGPDQLRQRVAFALSQIFVTSGIDINQPYAMAAYQQILLDDAFSTYRKLLGDVTLSPAMGRWLDMVNNDKANPSKGTSPNENYGREVLQLFSIGLVQLNADGTPQLDGSGQPIATYDQDTVEGFAYAFTGWTFAPLPGATSKWTNPKNYSAPMVAFDAHHDSSGSKKLLGGTVLPAGQTAVADLNAALDNIAAHPNVGPFIGKQLIQFLVTSNPSPAYVGRITAVWNDNGKGQRGDLGAVVRAILLDPEARGDSKADPAYGRLRDPAQTLVAAVRGLGGSSDGVYLEQASAALAQPVYNAASVFNFYPPDQPLSATSALVGPGFGVFNSATTFTRTNVLNTLLAGPVKADASVAGSSGTQLDLSSWQSLASDAGGLADQINRLFFHGAMSSALRNTLVQTVNGIPASDTATRARAALYLALSSAQYQVEQ